jgi:hypothetical protein
MTGHSHLREIRADIRGRSRPLKRCTRWRSRSFPVILLHERPLARRRRARAQISKYRRLRQSGGGGEGKAGTGYKVGVLRLVALLIPCALITRRCCTSDHSMTTNSCSAPCADSEGNRGERRSLTSYCCSDGSSMAELGQRPGSASPRAPTLRQPMADGRSFTRGWDKRIN